MDFKIQESNPLISKIVFDGQIFPVFKLDSLQTITERYIKMFPSDVKNLLAEIKLNHESLYNENAMSRDLAVVRFAAKIPVPIFYAMKQFDNEYWDYKLGLVHYRQLAQLCPKLMIGRV